jgi:hypothetical protein
MQEDGGQRRVEKLALGIGIADEEGVAIPLVFIPLLFGLMEKISSTGSRQSGEWIMGEVRR